MPANDTIVNPRPQRAKSVLRQTPSGYPICTNVAWPENDEPMPVWHRGTFASGPQFSTFGIGTNPLSCASIAPRLVTTFRFRDQLAPNSTEKSCRWIGRKFVVTSQPLLVKAP